MATITKKVETMGDIKDLAPLAKKLNARTDALNTALETIQAKINALNLGVEVWLDDSSLDESDWEDTLDRENEPTGARQFYFEELGYGRHGEGWALLVRTRRMEVFDGDYGGERRAYNESDPKPLLGSARKLRIAAVPLIPKLIDKLKDEASAALERIDEAQKIAESLE